MNTAIITDNLHVKQPVYRKKNFVIVLCVLRIALLCVPLLIPDVLQEGIKSIESKLDKHGKPMPVVLMKFQNSSDYHEK